MRRMRSPQTWLLLGLLAMLPAAALQTRTTKIYDRALDQMQKVVEHSEEQGEDMLCWIIPILDRLVASGHTGQASHLAANRIEWFDRLCESSMQKVRDIAEAAAVRLREQGYIALADRVLEMAEDVYLPAIQANHERFTVLLLPYLEQDNVR